MFVTVFTIFHYLDQIYYSTLFKCIILIFSFYLVYRYLTRNHDFWTKRGISGPKPVMFFGNTFSQLLTPRPILEMTWLKQYGKVYGVFLGNKPILVVSDPNLIKNILVKDFDIFPNRNISVSRRHHILKMNLVEAQIEDWRRIRTIVSPAFSTSRMKKMFPMIKECLIDFMSALETIGREKIDVNLLEIFGNLTMDVIATCAFSTKINAHKDPDHLFVKYARRIIKYNFWKIFAIQMLPKNVLNYLNIRSIFDEDSNEFFFELTRHIIRQRRNCLNECFDDFIQLLLTAEKNIKTFVETKDIFETRYGFASNEKVFIRSNSFEKYIKEDEILAQSWIFFMAGYETTATTLAFATHELAVNPDIQQILYEEVMTVVDSNGDIDYDLLSKLQFLDSIVLETLRLHSPFMRVGRTAATDYKLGDTGIIISRNQQVEIPIHAIHMCDEFYPDPFKFDPYRFMSENRQKLVPYTYLPFGGGPRNCIGMRFALMEIKLCLTQMIFRYKFLPCDKTDNPVQLKKSIFLNTPKRLFACFEKRKYV